MLCRRTLENCWADHSASTICRVEFRSTGCAFFFYSDGLSVGNFFLNLVWDTVLGARVHHAFNGFVFGDFFLSVGVVFTSSVDEFTRLGTFAEGTARRENCSDKAEEEKWKQFFHGCW